MRIASRVTFIFFILLVLFNFLGIFIVNTWNIERGLTFGDGIVGPAMLSFTVFIFFALKRKINSGLLIGIIHIIIWIIILLIAYNSEPNTKNPYAEPVEYFQDGFTYLTCSLFLLLNNWVKYLFVDPNLQHHLIYYVSDVFLMAVYLCIITNLAVYIEKNFKLWFNTAKSVVYRNNPHQ